MGLPRLVGHAFRPKPGTEDAHLLRAKSAAPASLGSGLFTGGRLRDAEISRTRSGLYGSEADVDKPWDQ
jgi:hypothetical protein